MKPCKGVGACGTQTAADRRAAAYRVQYRERQRPGSSSDGDDPVAVAPGTDLRGPQMSLQDGLLPIRSVSSKGVWRSRIGNSVCAAFSCPTHFSIG